MTIIYRVMVAFAFLFIILPSAYAAEKAEIIFVTKAIENDLTVNLSFYDEGKLKFSLKKGFNVIIGEGSPLFGPHSLETTTSRGTSVKLQKKSVKPGTYMFVNAIASNPGFETACFSNKSKMFTVEEGQSYFLTLPDAVPNKSESIMSWSLAPAISGDELAVVLEQYNAYKNGGLSSVTPLETELVSFLPRMKLGNCRTPKDHVYRKYTEE